jgi:hypothetical protein
MTFERESKYWCVCVCVCVCVEGVRAHVCVCECSYGRVLNHPIYDELVPQNTEALQTFSTSGHHSW